MNGSSLLKHPPRNPLIAASILSADFACMGDECRAALSAGADLLHLDVMDGHFVPNLTMGPDMCRSIHEEFPEICLDVHLMVTDPAQYVEAFAKAGASNFTFHVEAAPQPADLIRSVRGAGMTAGLAINPPSDVQVILPHIGLADVILIMSVNPGYAGQAFIGSVLDKVRRVKPLLKGEQRLEIDGGVNSRTAAECVKAGCDVLVAASAIFHADDYATAVEELRGERHSAARRA